MQHRSGAEKARFWYPYRTDSDKIKENRLIKKEESAMTGTVSVLSVILPVIVMIALGMLARKKHLISQKGIDDIKSILMNICIPALMFRTFYAADLTSKSALAVILMFAVTLATFAIGRLFRKLFRIRYEMGRYLCTSIEGGMLGYALFTLLFGQENLYHFALLDLGNALVLFPILMTRLRLRTENHVSGKDVARSMATPVNFAIAAGILISVTGLGGVIQSTGSGAVLDAVLNFAGGPTGALILIVVGYGLAFDQVPWPETIRTVIARLIIYGAFGVLVVRIVRVLFPGDVMYLYGAVMAFIMPPSFAYTVYFREGEESAYAGAVLAVYTIFTIIGFCLVAASAL